MTGKLAGLDEDELNRIALESELVGIVPHGRALEKKWAVENFKAGYRAAESAALSGVSAEFRRRTEEFLEEFVDETNGRLPKNARRLDKDAVIYKFRRFIEAEQY